ncbi:MAG: DUF4038 domain-containing protein [Caldicoprobacterales bacterium]|jgi:hypothetical protein
MITKIHVWDIIELAFTGRDVFQNPYTEADFSVRFVSQTGEQYTAPCFWDGDNVWKVRFAPPAPGLWHWESFSESEKGGFSGRRGKFEAVEYQGENPVFRHGFLKVNSNGRGFVHADDTPFFWTGDTVWAATSKASLDEWKEYIEFRSSQGFNVVQMNVLPQYDASGIESRSPFAADEDGQWDMYRIDPEYFRCLDEMMAVTRNAGMYTALVVVWYTYVEKIYEPEARPSKKARFDKKTIKLFARYLAARYAAFGAVWIVSGDSNYNAEKEEISVYHTAAETIKDAVSHYPLITAHLSGNTSTPEGINQAEWLDFHMYQSGHCTDGPAISVRYAEKDRALRPIRPVINAEPCYEGIGYIEGTRRVDQADIIGL